MTAPCIEDGIWYAVGSTGMYVYPHNQDTRPTEKEYANESVWNCLPSGTPCVFADVQTFQLHNGPWKAGEPPFMYEGRVLLPGCVGWARWEPEWFPKRFSQIRPKLTP